jgi:hypothetical protein
MASSSSSSSSSNNNKRFPPSFPYTDTTNNKKQKAISCSASSSTRDVVNNDDDDDNAKINNDGLLVSALALMGFPIPIRVSILNYLGETQDELINLTLVSKQMYEDCKRPGIEWKIIPRIEISALQQEGGGSTRTLLQILSHNQTNKKLDRYRHMRINDVRKFGNLNLSYNEMNNITKDVRIEGILSLDISLPYQSTITYICKSLPNALPEILTKLRELDFSNTSLSGVTLYKYSQNCRLEKITWYNIAKYSDVSLNGWDMQPAKNLKEIYMDSSFFCYYNTQKEVYLNLNDSTLNKYFIFYQCCKSLERVSIKNAKYVMNRYVRSPPEIIPQNALIKFVRNVPSLRWFRSDLTQENMDMLRLERPDIELLN